MLRSLDLTQLLCTAWALSPASPHFHILMPAQVTHQSIIWLCVSCWVWLISLSIVSCGCVLSHVTVVSSCWTAASCAFLLFSFPIYPSVNIGVISCLAVVTGAEMNVGADLLRVPTAFLWGYFQRRECWVLRNLLLRTSHTVLHIGCASLHFLTVSDCSLFHTCVALPTRVFLYLTGVGGN